MFDNLTLLTATPLFHSIRGRIKRSTQWFQESDSIGSHPDYAIAAHKSYGRKNLTQDRQQDRQYHLLSCPPGLWWGQLQRITFVHVREFVHYVHMYNCTWRAHNALGSVGGVRGKRGKMEWTGRFWLGGRHRIIATDNIISEYPYLYLYLYFWIFVFVFGGNEPDNCHRKRNCGKLTNFIFVHVFGL